MDSTPSPSTHCPNCQTPMAESARYCGHCGQKRIRKMVSLWELVSDFVVSVFNLESQTWRTLRDMVVPGKLTRAYFQGERARYLTPLRLFFLMAVAHFAVLGFRAHDALKDDLDRLTRQSRDQAYERLYGRRMDSLILEVRGDFPAAGSALDSLRRRGNIRADSSASAAGMGLLRFQDGKFSSAPLNLSLEDLYALAPEELAKKYEVRGPFEKAQLQIYQRAFLEPDNLIQFLLSKLIWMALLLVPAVALVLKFLYWRRRRYFVEHLVFGLHYHAFAFFLMALFFLTAFRQPQYLGGVLLVLFLFGLLAMKRYYGQGWFKTLIKGGFLHFVYLFLVNIFLVLAVLVSAFLFSNP